MKTLPQLVHGGYRLANRFELTRASHPQGRSDEYVVDSHDQSYLRIYDGFVDPFSKQFGFTHIPSDHLQELSERRQTEPGLLLEAGDYQVPPHLIHSEVHYGRLFPSFNGIEQEIQVKEIERPSLSQFAVRVSDNEQAQWALAPPGPGQPPQLLVFVPGQQDLVELLTDSPGQSRNLSLANDGELLTVGDVAVRVET